MAKIRHYLSWLENCGVNSSKWITVSDSVVLMEFISKLLAAEINKRVERDEMNYKVSFETLSKLLNECHGVPRIITENDLLNDKKGPAITALLILLKESTSGTITPAMVKVEPAPRLAFYPLTKYNFNICRACDLYCHIVDRVIIDTWIFMHRKCMLCDICKRQLFIGMYSISEGKLICFFHEYLNILKNKPRVALSQMPKVDQASASSSDQQSKAPKPAPRRTLAKAEPVNRSQSCDCPVLKGTTPIPPPRPKRAQYLLSRGIQPPSSSLPRDLNIQPIPKPRTQLPSKEKTKDTTDSQKDSVLCAVSSQCSAAKSIKGEKESNSCTSTATNAATPIEEYPNYLSEAELADIDFDKLSIEIPSHSVQCRSDESRDVAINPPNHVDAEQQLKSAFQQLSVACQPKIPLLKKRMIGFSDCVENSSEIYKLLQSVTHEFDEISVVGRTLEDHLSEQSKSNPSSWMKTALADDWFSLIVRLLNVSNTEAQLSLRYYGALLNELHSETEFQIRSILESENAECYAAREAELTKVLLAIIDRKSALSELMEDKSDAVSNEYANTNKSQKIAKLRKRIAVLSKKLRKF